MQTVAQKNGALFGLVSYNDPLHILHLFLPDFH